MTAPGPDATEITGLLNSTEETAQALLTVLAEPDPDLRVVMVHLNWLIDRTTRIRAWQRRHQPPGPEGATDA